MDAKVIQQQHCPPMLTVGQVATIAWLMKDQVLAPDKAGRELLAHCFAAIRPDATWFGFFREGMERLVGPLDDFTRGTSNSLTLQAARRIAQEESFGSAALVRELNMAEILGRAKEETDGLLARNQFEAEEAKQALKREAEDAMARVTNAARSAIDQAHLDRMTAVEDAAIQARQSFAAELAEENRRKSHKIATVIVTSLKLLSTLVFLVVVILDTVFRKEAPTWFHAIEVVLAFVGIASFLDLVGISIVKAQFAKLEVKLAHQILKLLGGSAGTNGSS
jgi:hypothetical protein